MLGSRGVGGMGSGREDSGWRRRGKITSPDVVEDEKRGGKWRQRQAMARGRTVRGREQTNRPSSVILSIDRFRMLTIH